MAFPIPCPVFFCACHARFDDAAKFLIHEVTCPEQPNGGDYIALENISRVLKHLAWGEAPMRPIQVLEIIADIVAATGRAVGQAETIQQAVEEVSP